MVYPRPSRSPVGARTGTGTVVDIGAQRVAFDPAASVDVRVAALWELRGADAFASLEARALASWLGDVLNEDDLVVASEAYEVLASLSVVGGDAMRDLAVGVDRRGRLTVAGRSFDACVRAEHGADVDGRIVPLVKIAALAPSTPAPVASWPRVIGGNDLVVERASTSALRAAALRVRGDEALVGSLRGDALQLPVERRQLRFRRQGDRWSVQDVYAEGHVTCGGAPLAGGTASVAHGTRIDVAGERGAKGVTLTTRLVPRLDRSTGVTVRFKDHGRRVERLAAGEALFFGPGPDDDVPSPVPARLVATQKGEAVLVSGAPLPQSGTALVVGPLAVRFEGADVVVAAVRCGTTRPSIDRGVGGCRTVRRPKRTCPTS